MATVVVTVKERIATIPSGVSLVCNNPSDVIQFDFDSEWNTETLKTARFSWQRSYVDIPFTGNTVNVPDISKTNVVELGVYTDDIASTPVKIPFKHSIKSLGGIIANPTADVYTQLVQMINGGTIKGEPGYTPVRGTDYWNVDDIATIQAYCEDKILEGKW